MTIAADLFALQEIDLSLDKALSRLAEIDEQTGETEELTASREAFEAATEVVRQLKSKQSDLEFEAEEVRIKAADVEQKLYSGRVTNPKELADLDADLKSIKALIKTREDVLLAHLEEAEAAEATMREAESTYRTIEAEWRDSQAHLVAEKAEIEPEIARLRARRDEEAGRIARAPIGLYALLRERRNGVAVAGVERGMCQGCRISLPSNLLQKARMPGAMVQCVSCERILLFT
ncbi:MAG: hypothetical protein WD472_00185 [Dehalococcoidia bacterium]